MSKFTFRLETKLKLCAAQRDQRRVELADALAQAEQVAKQIGAINAELQSLLATQSRRQGELDVERLLVHDRYAAVLRARRTEQEQRQTELAAEIVQRRDALLAADREVRTLERLREKQWTQFQEEQRRRDQHVLDEIGAQAHYQARS